MTRRRLIPVVTLSALVFQHRLLVSSFVVLPQSRGSTRIRQSSLDSFAAPALQVLRESSIFQTPVLCTTRHANNGVCSRCMVTMTSEIHASPTWEGFWSLGLEKGDMWDTGAVSPALQNLLDEGECEALVHVQSWVGTNNTIRGLGCAYLKVSFCFLLVNDSKVQALVKYNTCTSRYPRSLLILAMGPNLAMRDFSSNLQRSTMYQVCTSQERR